MRILVLRNQATGKKYEKSVHQNLYIYSPNILRDQLHHAETKNPSSKG